VKSKQKEIMRTFFPGSRAAGFLGCCMEQRALPQNHTIYSTGTYYLIYEPIMLARIQDTHLE